MTTNDDNERKMLRAMFDDMKGNDMTSTKSTRTRRTTKAVEPTIDVELDDVTVDVIEDDAPPPARKYFSHADCDHARQGDAGKKARAACRRAMRAVAEEADTDVAV